MCIGDYEESNTPVSKQILKAHLYSATIIGNSLLMRYEDWTFRETEIRLQEHIELRMALGLKQTPDYTTFYRYMRRLDENLIQNALQEVALQTMNNQPTKNAILAVDATGTWRH